MNLKKRFNFLLILCFFIDLNSYIFCWTLEKNIQENLIRNFSHHLIADCVIIIWKTDVSRSVDLMKTLSTQFWTIAQPIFNFPDAHSSLTGKCSRPMYVATDPMTHQETHNILSVTPGYSQVTWLLLYSILQDINQLPITFNNLVLSHYLENDALTIFESYKVAVGFPTRCSSYAKWTPKHGLVFEFNLLDRLNLEGIVLSAAIFESPPLNTILLLQNGKAEMDGYFGRVGQALEQKLNFSMAMTFWDSNSSWDKAIKALSNHEIDIIPSALEMSSSRIKLLSFTAPIESSTMDILIRRPDEMEFESSWWNYLDPFPWNLRICIFFMYIVVWNLLYIADRENPFTWLEYGLYVFGICFCSQSHPNAPQNAAARLIHLWSLVFTLILSASYAAVFVSFLTVKKFDMPFSTLEQMFDQRAYLLGVYPETQEYYDFAHATSGLQKEIFSTIMPINNFPNGTKEALDRVCQEKYAHIDYHSVLMLNTANCSLVALDEYYTRSTSAMALQRFSPYRKAFNKIINSMNSYGILKILKKYPIKLQNGRNEFETVSLSDIKFPLSLVLLGIVLAVIVLLCELIRFHYWQKRRAHIWSDPCTISNRQN